MYQPGCPGGTIKDKTEFAIIFVFESYCWLWLICSGMRQRFTESLMWGTSWRMCWYSMLVLHCNVGENVGILNQDCLVSKRIPARTTCHIVECDFPRKIFQVESPHATNCSMLHSYLDHLWSLVQCWHCKTITMGLAMTMALRETDITAKNLLCDAQTSPSEQIVWSHLRNFLIIRNPKHMKWKALGFASAGDLPRLNLIFWLLDCPTNPFHLYNTLRSQCHPENKTKCTIFNVLIPALAVMCSPMHKQGYP